MRRYARSENPRIVRKEKIGSRVFPFRTPPASMPSVGTRRSTRVFVPKTVSKPGDGDPARVLRSGKRFPLSKSVGKRADGDGDGDEWMRLFGNAGYAADYRWWKEDEEEKDGFVMVNGRHAPVVPESAVEISEPFPESDGKRFGIVYSRKRPRSRPDGSVSSSFQSGDRSRMFGIAFVRKQRRKKAKVTPLAEEVSGGTEIRVGEPAITESARNFAKMAGILEGDIGFGLVSPVVLAVFIESSCNWSSHRFGYFLISILNWMRRTRLRFLEFAAFLLSKSIAGVFSLHGIHFLPVQHSKNNVICRNAISACGLCILFGARQFVPLVTLGFSALPFYFKSLHVSMILGSQYLSDALARYVMGLRTDLSVVVRFEEYDSSVPAEIESPGVEITAFPAEIESPGVEITAFGSSARNRNRLAFSVGAPESFVWSANIANVARLRKHRRKRSSLRYARIQNPSLLHSHAGRLRSHCSSVKFPSAAKVHSLQDSLVEPVREKPLETCLGEFLSIGEQYAVSSPPWSNQKQRNSKRKKPVERIKELKPALAEVKQNIDSARCSANVLVTDSDRCWREEGAEVMLECSGSKEWCIAVRTQGIIRYLHKPQEMRPSVFNRHTHANMWSGEDGWKLEFCDKWDWVVFKELHRECRERNVQDVSVKIIPVPGVREVSGYEDNVIASFVRPQMYIKMMDDEIERALMSEIANYDMDSGDEEWFKQLNSSSLHVESSGFSHILEENFEKIIFVLEKNAYGHPDDISDRTRALDLCQNLGQRDTVEAVFDYWLNKRHKRRSALIKVFQGPPVRRAQLVQKPFLRKKRSFQRQRIQGGRGKAEYFLQAGAKQDEIRRVQEAESAANKAVEAAIHLRSRAQMCMVNAELAAYKSVMALRLAEALHESETPDLASSFLNLIPKVDECTGVH